MIKGEKIITTLTGASQPARGWPKLMQAGAPACALHTDIYLHSDRRFTKSFVFAGAKSYERLPAYIVKQAL